MIAQCAQSVHGLPDLLKIGLGGRYYSRDGFGVLGDHNFFAAASPIEQTTESSFGLLMVIVAISIREGFAGDY